MSKTLLQEALADAKDFQKMAIENAKQNLEKLITPKIKALLEAKLSESLGEAEEETEDDEMCEGMSKSVKAIWNEIKGHITDPEKRKEMAEALKSKEEAPAEEEKPAEETDEEFDLDVALAEVESQLEKKDEKPAEEEKEEEPAEETDEDFDIDAILAELDDTEEEPAEEEKLDEASPSDIVKKAMEAIAKIIPDKAKLQAISNAISAAQDRTFSEAEEEKPAEEEEVSETILELKNDLVEAKKVIGSMKDQINESNLLAVKLTCITKLITEGSLNEEEQAKIISAFDKPKTAGEATTMFEALKLKISSKPKRKSLTESLGITNTEAKPKEQKQEYYDIASEFQKRAGITK